MLMFRHFILLLATVVTGFGCASYDFSDYDRNQIVTEFYAQVTDIEDIHFASQTGEAALSWGLWGALENSHGDRGDIIGGALVGAFFGSLITAIAEGPRDGYEYHLQAIDGDQLIVVLDYFPADIGECVQVRMTSQVYVTVTDPIACEVDLES